MSNDTKPREFWIHFTHNLQEETFVHLAEVDCDLGCDMVHVIEFAAYIDKVKAHSDLAVICKSLSKESDDFKSQLAVCLAHGAAIAAHYEVIRKERDDYLEALEGFLLSHEHAPNLPHTRAMGDTYGWCDFCSTKVKWGPCEAEQVLSKYSKEK